MWDILAAVVYSGKMFVTVSPDHFGPILAEKDPERLCFAHFISKSRGRDLSGNKRTNKTLFIDQKFDKSTEAL
ncbi:hypothetical protein M8C21_029581, partial [Ambrosia artemisiifolia]